MAKKPNKLKARLPRGFVDRSAGDIRATDEMLGKIRAVYERYGFDPVETPAFEYTDCLASSCPIPTVRMPVSFPFRTMTTSG